MSEKTKKSLKIVSQEEIGKDIYSMWLQADEMAESARPGQFLSLYTRDGSKLLPRPISICEIDRENKRIRLVYRVTGKNTGTEAFSKLHAGIAVEVLGPLGNGFPLHEAEGKRVFLMGGGIGIPPMLQTAKELNGEKTAVLGYRDELFLNEEFEKYADVFVATEDGSAGTKGNVMDAIRENALEADVILHVVQLLCFVLSKIMQKKRIFRAGSLWRNVWPAESAPVLPVCANQKRLTAIPMCIINVSVKTDRYF